MVNNFDSAIIQYFTNSKIQKEKIYTFSSIYDLCDLPLSATTAKKGDSSNVANYRPIAITSVLSKIMEKVINEQVLRHLESNNLIHDRQYFRQFGSTGDILAHITLIWNKALETGRDW